MLLDVPPWETVPPVDAPNVNGARDLGLVAQGSNESAADLSAAVRSGLGPAAGPLSGKPVYRPELGG